MAEELTTPSEQMPLPKMTKVFSPRERGGADNPVVSARRRLLGEMISSGQSLPLLQQELGLNYFIDQFIYNEEGSVVSVDRETLDQTLNLLRENPGEVTQQLLHRIDVASDESQLKAIKMIGAQLLAMLYKDSGAETPKAAWKKWGQNDTVLNPSPERLSVRFAEMLMLAAEARAVELRLNTPGGFLHKSNSSVASYKRAETMYDHLTSYAQNDDIAPELKTRLLDVAGKLEERYQIENKRAKTERKRAREAERVAEKTLVGAVEEKEERERGVATLADHRKHRAEVKAGKKELPRAQALDDENEDNVLTGSQSQAEVPTVAGQAGIETQLTREHAFELVNELLVGGGSAQAAVEAYERLLQEKNYDDLADKVRMLRDEPETDAEKMAQRAVQAASVAAGWAVTRKRGKGKRGQAQTKVMESDEAKAMASYEAVELESKESVRARQAQTEARARQFGQNLVYVLYNLGFFARYKGKDEPIRNYLTRIDEELQAAGPVGPLYKILAGLQGIGLSAEQIPAVERLLTRVTGQTKEERAIKAAFLAERQDLCHELWSFANWLEEQGEEGMIDFLFNRRWQQIVAERQASARQPGSTRKLSSKARSDIAAAQLQWEQEEVPKLKEQERSKIERQVRNFNLDYHVALIRQVVYELLIKNLSVGGGSAIKLDIPTTT